MDEIKVEVKYSKQNIYDCYFDKSFYNTLDIKYFETSLVFGVIFLLLYFLSLIVSKTATDYFLAIGFLLFPSIVMLKSFFEYLIRSYKWKSQIDDYIKTQTSYKKVVLTINSKGCGIEYDDDNQFRYWDHVSKYNISKNLIQIFDKDGHSIIIPKNAIDSQTYNNIIKVLESKGDLLQT